MNHSKKFQMKNIFTAIAFLFCFSVFAQTHVEWDKDNFPGKKDEYKEAKKMYEEGKKMFEEGKKMHDEQVDWMAKEYKHYPNSRADLKNAGNDLFIMALPLLKKANDFNPDHAMNNYMIAFCHFAMDPQHDLYVKFFEKAYKLNPNVTIDEKYYMAWGYHLNLKWDDAIKEYKEVMADLMKDQKKYALWIEDCKKKIQECMFGKEYTAKPVRVFIDNIGNGINTNYPDFGALITADESMMIFTSRRNTGIGGLMEEGTGQYYEDLYVSYKRYGKWEGAQNLGPAINTPSHDATAGLSHDGTIMYIYRFEDKDGGDIWESRLTGNTWSKPERLNKNINSRAHESTVSLSYDDKQLYFISDKEGTTGDRDIWISNVDAKGKWQEAYNAGPVINTKFMEEGVYLHPDGKTMYFSSRGHSTMGGLDIFKSEFKDGKWGTPINMGYPINTPHDDVFFNVSASGRRGYYASAKQGGYGEKDIYVITFLGEEKPFILSNEDNLIASIAEPVKSVAAAPAMEIKANSVTILKGTITDALTNKPVEASIDLVDNVKNQVIATFKSNSLSGKYLVSLPAGRNYGIAVKNDNYLFHSENFDIPENNGYLEVVKDVQLKNVAVGSKIVLRNIFFDFDKSTLKTESTAELERLIKLLNDLPTMKIEIGGHTDSKGSDDYNMKLSGSRAKAVVDYLVTHGIGADRLKSNGYGETQPISTNDSDDGRALNRRTEFTILSK
jgi:outer membrane protein OmpA-like peptidoglycan-associated protein/tetratricopeptide (TPR) repeat protein